MKDVDVNLLPALLKRESGYSTSFKERHISLVSSYGALYPNACVKLRTAEATNIQFSPCGAYVLGINSSGHSIAIWDVDSFLGGLWPPARTTTGGSCVHHNLSNSAAGSSSANAAHPALNTEPENTGGASYSQRPGPRTGVRNNDAVACADVARPQKPALTFSSSLFAHFTPVWKGQKRPLLGHHGHDRGGMHKLAPVEVGDAVSMIEEARSVLCTPAEPLDDAQLQQVWDRRSREQEAMIASWNESRKRLRRSRHSTDRVPTATSLPSVPSLPSILSMSALAPTRQPPVITAPSITPILNICGSSSESRPDEIFVETGSAAVVATVTAGHEKVNDTICLFTRDRRHVLLLAESQATSATGEQTAGASSSVIMVSLQSGQVVDRLQFKNERLVMQRNRSCVTWSLYYSTLVILCPKAQQVHIYQVSRDSLVHNRTLGLHLRHDDELSLANLASAEQQYRSTSTQDKCPSAHGDLLPRGTADASANAAARVSNPATSDRNDSNPRRGQAGNRSSDAGSAANASPREYHITGLKQRVEAFVYQKALDGEDLGVGHLFQTPEKSGKPGALDELVHILHSSDSLVKTLVAMSKLSLQKELANESETHSVRVAEAVGRFHRFRSGLEEASISAVHAVDQEHMLMLMYSHELTHLHDSCIWKAHMPHSLVMQQQLNTLAEQAVGGSRRLPARPTSPRIHAGTAGNSGRGLSRNRVHRSASAGSFSQLAMLHTSQNGAAAQGPVEQVNTNLREQVAAVLQDARKVGPERMGQFLLWHLPGASQGSWASPYTNPLLFLPIRKDCIVHFHGSRTLRFSASSTRIEFFPGSHLFHSSSEPVFELDWSMMINDLDPSDASQPKFCDVKFHPFLPLVITCFPSLSCFCVHYRRM